MPNPQSPPPDTAKIPEQLRRHWLSVLAKAEPDQIEALWSDLPEQPNWTPVRQPETGMVMVRGRVGGDGNRFNLGEMTMTRSAVRLSNGQTGLGYVQGRSRRHAELTAVLDAMLQSPEYRSAGASQLIEALVSRQAEQRDVRSRKAATTKVEFFTMVRGNG
jgi:alpha-D-ribose 1-methylphosphonate 5-triphosphate synthase subunit PhnG